MNQIDSTELNNAPQLDDMAGQYLTFNLGQEYFGLEILKIQEIIGILKITKMPRFPDYISGVISLRGKIVPVLDLRLRFGMESTEHTKKTVILVVLVSNGNTLYPTGLLVDQVNEVIDLIGSELELPQDFGIGTNSEQITAMGKIGGNVVMLLDINKIISPEESRRLEQKLNETE